MAVEWKNEPGFLVTLEGGEGSGKSTLKEKLSAAFSDQKITCTFEPGGTDIGLQIRKVLMDMGNNRMHPIAEFLLFSAVRAQLVQEVVQPVLKRGELVICDRFYDSSLAYQGYGHGLDLAKLMYVTDLATNGIRPDITLLLDVDPEIGLRRRKEAGVEWNRLDDLALELHTNVRRGYLELATNEPDRIKVINSKQNSEQVFNEAFNLLVSRMRAVGYLGSL